MAEFSLHPRFHADQIDRERADELLAEYVEEYDDVTLEPKRTDSSPSDAGVFHPETFLEIDDLDVYAEIYRNLRDDPAVADVGLWGPTAERFPILVQHYALQQISTPHLFEFYAIDDRVTLVICDNRQQVEQLRREIPSGARG